jgi:Ca2+-binding RTX toxin-like protein
MASLESYAALSSHVYGGKSLPPGWEPVLKADGYPMQSWGENGYYGALFRETGTGEIALVSRGTEFSDPGDRRADLAIMAGRLPSAQLGEAQALFQWALESGVPREQITFVGHSLGGSLAQLMGAVHDLPAVSFNAFPVRNLLPALGLDRNGIYRITDVADAADPVAHMGPSLGTRLEYAADQLPFTVLYGPPPLGEHADLLWWVRYYRTAHGIDSLTEKIRTAEATAGPCPVVLDLDGDGVETTSLAAGALFDHDADGFAERSAWVGADDGLLVHDRDGDGRITSGRELFGNHTLLGSGALAANGYQALAELDANGDGRVDATDPAFGRLRVWRDGDGDGVAAPGELQDLEALGIAAIATTYAESAGVDANGNAHRQVGVFTRVDGTTRASADVWFVADRVHSLATDWVELPAGIAGLPDATGYGTIRDLRQAMARDASGALESLVGAFAAAEAPAERDQLLEQILYAWTGAAGIDPASRGPAMDARRLAVLEGFSGEPYVGLGGAPDPNLNAGVILEEAYRDLSELVYAQLMVQTHLASLDRLITYRWDDVAQSLRGDLGAVAAELDDRLAADPAGGRVLLGEFARVVRGFQAESVLDYWGFRERFAQQDPDLAWVMDAAGRPVLDGTPGDDALSGGDGADAIRGGAGSDTLAGRAGQDALHGGDGADVLAGDDGADLLVGGPGADDLSGGAGPDRLEGGDGGDRLYGDPGDDVLVGGAGADVLSGGDGADTLDGGPDADTLDGGLGDDTYILRRGSGPDTVTDSDWQVPSVDRVRVEDGIAPGEVVVLRDGEDLLLRLGEGGDEMRLRSWFLEGFGSEYQVQRVEFGDGTVWEVSALKQMALRPTAGPDLIVGYGGPDTIAALEGDDEVYGRGGDDRLEGGPGADRLHGEAGNDLLLGEADADQLWGEDGDDTLDGGPGDDSLNGGFGNDTYLLARGTGHDTVTDNDWQVPSTDRVLAAADLAPSDVAVSRDGNDLALEISGTGDRMRLRDWFLEGFGSEYQVQRVEFADGTVWDVPTLRQMAEGPGTQGPDTLVGTAGADLLLGLGGDDTLYGRGGDDRLDGGAGADRMYGEGGNDTYVVEAAGDLVSEGVGQGTDTVLASVDYALPANVEHLTLTGLAAVRATGNGLTNTLTGNAGANVLDGKGGADLMAGGAGDDTYYVGQAGDRVQEAPGEGADTVYSAVSFTLDAHLEDLRLTGTKAINATGNALANALTGNKAANVLDGREGADVLAGGAGNDLYHFDRGAGQDRIVENDSTAGNRDTVRYGAGISPIDLIVGRSLDHLVLAVHGSADTVTVQDWYRGSAHRVEVIQAGDGSQLASGEVDRLIQAMASFTVATGLDWAQAIDERPEDVQAILAAHWQPASS